MHQTITLAPAKTMISKKLIILGIALVVVAILIINPLGIRGILDPGSPPVNAYDGINATSSSGAHFTWKVVTSPDAWWRHITDIQVQMNVIRTYHYVWKTKEALMMMAAVDSLATGGQMPNGFFILK